ncbi:unnamed protein product [Lampetra planeri]
MSARRPLPERGRRTRARCWRGCVVRALVALKAARMSVAAAAQGGGDVREGEEEMGGRREEEGEDEGGAAAAPAAPLAREECAARVGGDVTRKTPRRHLT